MSSCPDNYTQVCELCVPNSYNLTAEEIEILKRKLLGAAIMLLPDKVTTERFKSSGPPVANP